MPPAGSAGKKPRERKELISCATRRSRIRNSFRIGASGADPDIPVAIFRDRYRSSERASVRARNFRKSSTVVDRKNVIDTNP